MNGVPEVTNAWLSLAHDEFGADAGPVARRRHPDFLRTVQFVLPGVAQVRRSQASAMNAGPGTVSRRAFALQGSRTHCQGAVLSAYRANARSVAQWARLT